MQVINPHNVSLNNVIIKGDGRLTIGKNVEIRDFTVIEASNGHIDLGENSVIGYHSFIQATGSLIVGSNSLLGPHCSYICSSHPVKKGAIIRNYPLTRGSIKIGSNVWVGANCTINVNTHLHDSSIIGANSFVKTDIPSYEIWAGSPAKFIKVIT